MPAVELLGLVNVWLIVEPEPFDDPVIPPVIVPIVQLKVLDALAVSDIFGPVPLHIEAVVAVVTLGEGLTVTVIVVDGPVHKPPVETGVTIYCTVPAVELLGLLNVWLIVEPDPADAPVIPPVIVPIVQLKVLAALAVSDILGLVPLQIDAVLAVVTLGIGFTVTVIVVGEPAQEPTVDVGVTI